VLTLRRVVQVGLLGTLTFLVTYVTPQTALERALVATVAALLGFTQIPVLFAGRRPRRRPPPRRASPRPAPDSPRRPRLRSRVRQRWPRISGRLPGFRPRRPADLPERLPTFRGRRTELSRLEGKLQALRTPPAKDTPVVVIHGMPGVGKSAFAQELAHRVAHRYPHGQLYANLGSSGAERSAGEVLREFLIALGWPEPEIPADTRTRGKIFRSLTRHRRILVVLDAARDHSQVKELLPNGHRQAVIVTSRRDLGPELDAVTLPLTTPSTGEAVEMLRAVASAGPGEAPVHAVSIVRRCGHLPRALRAAGGHVAAGRGRLRDVAQRLSTDLDLLDYLSHGGVNLAAGFESEYQRLLPREREALRLLSLVESPTFVPWVLCPLLQVELTEAENLVTRLGAAHLLEVVGPGGVSGAARYRFHPLVHRFTVVKRGEEDDPHALDRARTRMRAAYRGVIRTILTRLAEPVRRANPQESKWLPPEFILDRIAESPEWWVRTEHANLVRCAEQAKQRREWDLYWQIARWLGGCLPPGMDPASVADGLQAALAATDRHTSTEVTLEVRLAGASLLAATDRHQEAERLITTTVELATAAQLPAQVAAGHRRRAEALLQIGAYESAGEALRGARQAAELAQRAGLDGHGERVLIALLEHVCLGHQEPAHWLAEPPDEPLPAWHDSGRFCAQLTRADAAARQGAWDTATAELADALDANRDDAGRVATVEFRQARLYLMRARCEPTGGARTAPALRAAERAAESLLTYRGLHSRGGELRARCLLTRALAAAGWVDEADWQGDKAYHALRAVAVPAIGQVATELLHAAVDQANGEVRLLRLDHPVPWQRIADQPGDRGRPGHRRGSPDQQIAEAVRLFRHAGSIFRRHGDWWSTAECELGLGRASRGSRHLSQAMAALWAAAASFEEAGDPGGHRAAITELIATAEAMGHAGTIADLRRRLDTRR
jgi:hypothetical protein